jgi:hypothetical protein
VAGITPPAVEEDPDAERPEPTPGT